MTIRVVLADDHPIFRDGLVRSLEEGGRFTVVGAGGSADEAVALAAEHATRPRAARHLDAGRRHRGRPPDRRRRHPPRIAMLTVSESDQDVIAALRAGAIGYVLKGISAAELAEVLTGIAAGEAHVSSALAARILNDIEQPAAPTRSPPADRRPHQARGRHPAPGRPRPVRTARSPRTLDSRKRRSSTT